MGIMPSVVDYTKGYLRHPFEVLKGAGPTRREPGSFFPFKQFEGELKRLTHVSFQFEIVVLLRVARVRHASDSPVADVSEVLRGHSERRAPDATLSEAGLGSPDVALAVGIEAIASRASGVSFYATWNREIFVVPVLLLACSQPCLTCRRVLTFSTRISTPN